MDILKSVTFYASDQDLEATETLDGEIAVTVNNQNGDKSASFVLSYEDFYSLVEKLNDFAESIKQA